MRIVKMYTACSLDGYVAGHGGDTRWISLEGDDDRDAFIFSSDTALIGRRSFEHARGRGGEFFLTATNYVFSSTLPPGRSDDVEIIAEPAATFVSRLKQQPGEDIWLFGGPALTASLLDAGLVDHIVLNVHPILLGGGTPLFARFAHRQLLKCLHARPFPSGVVNMVFDVIH